MKNKIKVLNLYACLGGNRYKWGDQFQVTAVENDPELARLYKIRFPNDTVIIGDAHQYLLNHYHEFAIIWASPPCPSHSRARFWFSSSPKTKVKPVYPDFTLYQEITFLHHYFKGLWIVENVIPYYKPLLPAIKIGRHLYWANFNISKNINHRTFDSRGAREITRLYEFHEIDLKDYKGKQSKKKIARNLVDYVVGESIITIAESILKEKNITQCDLFNPIPL